MTRSGTTPEDLLSAISEQLPEEPAAADLVDEASDESFPASDAPGWIRESL